MSANATGESKTRPRGASVTRGVEKRVNKKKGKEEINKRASTICHGTARDIRPLAFWTLYQSTSRQLRQLRRNQKVLTRRNDTTHRRRHSKAYGDAATAENPTRQSAPPASARVSVLHFKFPRAKRPVKFDANARACTSTAAAATAAADEPHRSSPHSA